MKKACTFFVLALSVFLVLPASAQLFQLTTVSENGQSLNSVPRFTWRLPFNSKLLDIGENSRMFGGILLKNEGLIYDRNGNRFKHRNISLGPNLGVMLHIKKQFNYVISYGADINLHYKEKVFVNGDRQEKEVRVSEWTSGRVSRFNHFIQTGFTLSDNVYLFGEYYFNDFFNQDFTETVNGVETQPYRNLEVSRFNLGLTVLILDGWW